MTVLNTADILAQEGFRTAPTMKERIIEASRLFNDGMTGKPFARARLIEAFSTSDFPTTLAKAFDVEAIQHFKQYTPEWSQFVDDFKVADFRPKKLRDLFGSNDFLDVNEGEEYKAGTLDETEYEIKAGKTGRAYGLTWELMLNGDFTELAKLPERLANAARKVEDTKVFEQFVTAQGPNTGFFKGETAPEVKPLNADNLQQAIEKIVVREKYDGELVDASNLILLVPPALQFKAKQILATTELEVTDGNKKVKIPNPFSGLVTLIVSRGLQKIDKSAKAAGTWYLFPGKGSENPALGKATLVGHESPDIRVKRDQGQSVGGGDIPIEEGSFKEDTTWYRGRHVTGGAALMPYATYVSTGS